MQVCTQAWGKTASIRLGESGEAVDAGDQDVLDAALAQVVEDREPELRALRVLPPDAERLAVAVDGNADGEIAGARADRAVLGDLHVQRVEVDDRVDALQRPRAPRGDVLQHGVGDAADRVAADLDAVEALQVRGDVAHRHAAGVEVEHALVQAREPGLALGDQLGVKRAAAVARRAHRHLAELGLERLGRRPIALVARAAGWRLPGRIPEVLRQLGAQRRLDHATRELREQPAGPGDLLGLESRQGVLKRVGRQQRGQPVEHLLTGTLRPPRPRRLKLSGLDLLLGHGWLSRPQGPRRSPRPHTEHRTEPDRRDQGHPHAPIRRLRPAHTAHGCR